MTKRDLKLMEEFRRLHVQAMAKGNKPIFFDYINPLPPSKFKMSEAAFIRMRKDFEELAKKTTLEITLQ